MLNRIRYNKAIHWLTALLAFAVPLEKRFVPWIIILIGLVWLLQGSYRLRFTMVRSDRDKVSLMGFTILYLLYLVGMINTTYISEGLQNLETKLSLLLFPLFFATFDRFQASAVRRVFSAFVAGCLAATLVCFAVALDGYLETGDKGLFYYRYLSYFHHAAYFSMYINFALVILLFYILLGQMTNRTWRVTAYFLVLYFMWFNVLLSSKAGILGMILMVFVAFIYLLLKKQPVMKGMIHFVIAIVYIYLLINIFPYSMGRFETARDTVSAGNEIDASTTEGTGERILVWQSALHVFYSNFFTGTGTGDVQPALREEYAERGIQDAIAKNLNAHNDYLQVSVAIGISGLLVLLLMLLLPLMKAIRDQHYVYLSFLILIAFNMLFESLLQTQAGVVFYAFFNAMLFSQGGKTAEDTGG